MANKILKTFYFVRHGRTEGNAKDTYQGNDIPLSPEGEKQAESVAERFKNISTEMIFSSDYMRAKQTAEAISRKNGAEIKFSPLFREIRRPSEIIGKEKSDGEPKKIMDEIIRHELEPNWHYSDEETLFDADARARAALRFLLSRPEKKVAVVTHEMFLKMMISAMVETDAVRSVEFLRTIRYFMIGENTGITVAEYGDFGFGERFRLRIWNDHAHL